MTFNFEVERCECDARNKAVMPCLIGSNNLEYRKVKFVGKGEGSVIAGPSVSS